MPAFSPQVFGFSATSYRTASPHFAGRVLRACLPCSGRAGNAQPGCVRPNLETVAPKAREAPCSTPVTVTLPSEVAPDSAVFNPPYTILDPVQNTVSSTARQRGTDAEAVRFSRMCVPPAPSCLGPGFLPRHMPMQC